MLNKNNIKADLILGLVILSRGILGFFVCTLLTTVVPKPFSKYEMYGSHIFGDQFIGKEGGWRIYKPSFQAVGD
jgi:hypothetical protein